MFDQKNQDPKVSVFCKTMPNTDNEEQELGFFSKGEDGNEHPIVLGADGKVHPNVKYNHCKDLGHCKAQYPKLKGKTSIKKRMYCN